MEKSKKEEEVEEKEEEEKEEEVEKTSYTLSDVAKHNKYNDLWVSVHGKVYDLTGFKGHPGGFSVLKELAGTNATSNFIQ
jgi:cytochrome b involved in lipid metabolism